MSSSYMQQQILNFIKSFPVISQIEKTMTQEMPWNTWYDLLHQCVVECDERKFISNNQPEILLKVLIKWKSILDQHSSSIPLNAMIAAEDAIKDFNSRCQSKFST